MNLAGFRIYTSELLGELVVPQYPRPERLKKYKRRTVKRWRRQNPPYYVADGRYYIDERRAVIYCHPDDLRNIAALIDATNKKAGALGAGLGPFQNFPN